MTDIFSVIAHHVFPVYMADARLCDIGVTLPPLHPHPPRSSSQRLGQNDLLGGTWSHMASCDTESLHGSYGDKKTDWRDYS